MNETFVRSIEIAADHPAFNGHFPGRPLLPGVSLLAEVLEAALNEPALVRGIGAVPRIAVAKFLVPVLPGAKLEIAFRRTAKGIEFSVSEQSRVVASGQFGQAESAMAVAP